MYNLYDLPYPINHQKLGGIKLIISPDRLKYELPTEVIPGVPWPEGFREEINNWSKEFIGTFNLLPKGQMYLVGGKTFMVRREDFVKIQNLLNP
jgi:hypothetical protein